MQLTVHSILFGTLFLYFQVSARFTDNKGNEKPFGQLRFYTSRISIDELRKDKNNLRGSNETEKLDRLISESDAGSATSKFNMIPVLNEGLQVSAIESLTKTSSSSLFSGIRAKREDDSGLSVTDQTESNTISAAETTRPGTTTNAPVESTTNGTVESTTNSEVQTTTNATVLTTTNATVESTTNGTVESTTNSALQTTTNATVESTTNSAVQTTTNAAVETTTNAVVETTTNAVVETTTNAVVETTTNAATITTTNAPVESTTNAAVETTTNIPVESTTNKTPERTTYSTEKSTENTTPEVVTTTTDSEPNELSTISTKESSVITVEPTTATTAVNTTVNSSTLTTEASTNTDTTEVSEITTEIIPSSTPSVKVFEKPAVRTKDIKAGKLVVELFRRTPKDAILLQYEITANVPKETERRHKRETEPRLELSILFIVTEDKESGQVWTTSTETVNTTSNVYNGSVTANVTSTEKLKVYCNITYHNPLDTIEAVPEQIVLTENLDKALEEANKASDTPPETSSIKVVLGVAAAIIVGIAIVAAVLMKFNQKASKESLTNGEANSSSDQTTLNIQTRDFQRSTYENHAFVGDINVNHDSQLTVQSTKF